MCANEQRLVVDQGTIKKSDLYIIMLRKDKTVNDLFCRFSGWLNAPSPLSPLTLSPSHSLTSL